MYSIDVHGIINLNGISVGNKFMKKRYNRIVFSNIFVKYSNMIAVFSQNKEKMKKKPHSICLLCDPKVLTMVSVTYTRV